MAQMVDQYRNSVDGTFFECQFCAAPESPARTLKRCSGCQLVTYCSRNCQKDDRKAHKPICEEFPVVNGKNVLHASGPWEEHIARLRERATQLPDPERTIAKKIFQWPKSCHTCRESRPELLTVCSCTAACHCSTACSNADKNHCQKSCSTLNFLKTTFSLHMMQKAYPASFWNFLERTNGIKGRDDCHLKSLTTMNIHILVKTGYFDALSWEFLFHQLPNLEQLNLVFVIKSVRYDSPYDHCDRLTRLECENCNINNRIITYAVYQKPYHMFFSSAEYTEPDFVVAYGIPYDINDIHSKISYRNMMFCKHSILVLMDSTKELLIKGTKCVKEAQTSSECRTEVLYPPERNQARGFGSNIANLDFDADAPNVKDYMTCLYTVVDF